MIEQVDPRRWVESLERYRVDLVTPAQVSNFECYVEHITSEQAGDLERILAHMTDDVLYRNFGATVGTFQGKEEVRRRFLPGVEAGFPMMEMQYDSFIVGSSSIGMAGTLYASGTATQLRGVGRVLPDETQDDDMFIVATPIAVFFTYRDGLTCGEDAFRSAATVTRIGSPSNDQSTTDRGQRSS
jgi:hypothetical protein